MWQTLNSNSGGIQALFSVIITAVTVVNVIIAAFMWKEMNRQNAQIVKPNVQMVLRPHDETNGMMVILRNVGSIPVYNVQVEVNIEGSGSIPEYFIHFLAEPFVVPLPVLLDGESISHVPFIASRDLANVGDDDAITFTVRYRVNPRSRERTEKFRYVLSIFVRRMGDGQEQSAQIPPQLMTNFNALAAMHEELTRLLNRLNDGQ